MIAMRHPKHPDVLESTKTHFVTCLLVPVVSLVRANVPFAVSCGFKLDAETKFSRGKADYTGTCKIGVSPREHPIVIEVKRVSADDQLRNVC